MSYLDKNLIPGEEIAFRTKKNLILFLMPVVWTIITLFFYINSNPIVVKIGFIPAIATAVVWINGWLDYVTSEFAVTNKRVFMKEGFFFRHINETQLRTISNVTINQSLIGRIMNYGTVWVNTFGGENDPFTEIASPNEFQKQVQIQLDKVGK